MFRGVCGYLYGEVGCRDGNEGLGEHMAATASSCGCPGRYRVSSTTIPSHLYGDRVSSHLYGPTHFFSLSHD